MRNKETYYNPFRNAFVVDPIAELERAIRRARELSLPKIRKPRFIRYKILLLNRIQTIQNILTASFTKIIRTIPSVNSIHEFYRAVINIYSSIDDFKKQLGRIHGSIRIIKKLSNEYIRNIRSVRQTKYLTEKEIIGHLRELWRQYLSRLVSFIHEVKDAFYYLIEIIRKMKRLPDYNPEFRTIVVCGPPNSGKSSLVGALSNAKVEVAEYPFTTKNLVFGHIELNSTPPIIVQIVDSPGLFDRPISERKPEELLALEAIRTIADCAIFMFDCSIERTLEAEQQMQVYKDVNNFFRGKTIITVLNKIDIEDPALKSRLLKLLEQVNQEPLLISVKHRWGLEKLIGIIRKELLGEKK